MSNEGIEGEGGDYFDHLVGALGRMVIQFNNLEVAVGRLIARLLKQDDVTAGVFAGSIFFRKN